jgi:hypothetical protein
MGENEKVAVEETTQIKDTFYEDIARRLAEEIEAEEA